MRIFGTGLQVDCNEGSCEWLMWGTVIKKRLTSFAFERTARIGALSSTLVPGQPKRPESTNFAEAKQTAKGKQFTSPT